MMHGPWGLYPTDPITPAKPVCPLCSNLGTPEGCAKCGRMTAAGAAVDSVPTKPRAAPEMCCGGTAVRAVCDYHKDTPKPDSSGGAYYVCARAATPSGYLYSLSKKWGADTAQVGVPHAELEVYRPLNWITRAVKPDRFEVSDYVVWSGKR